MTRATLYPPANRTAAWYSKYPGVDMDGIDKLLLHCTEGPSWPAYDGGALRPTLTYHPTLRAWRQHGRLDYSARALQDPTATPVRENRDKVVQVEIVGTCDPVAHRAHPKWPFMPALTDDNLDDLAELLAFLHEEWGTPLRAIPLWLPYPASFGPSRARLSSAQFDTWTGLLGHEHASGNDHGDPGNIDAHGIVVRAQIIVTPPKPPATTPPSTTSTEDTMELRTYAGKTYLFWGFFRRNVEDNQVAEAVRTWGPSKPASLLEMAMHTPFDTLVDSVWGGARTGVDDIEEQGEQTQAMVDAVGAKVDELLERVPAAPPAATAE